MKFQYLNETDTFYLVLSDKKSVESEEISDEVIADYDESGTLIGLEILSAKGKIDFSSLLFDSLPFQNINFVNNGVFA